VHQTLNGSNHATGWVVAATRILTIDNNTLPAEVALMFGPRGRPGYSRRYSPHGRTANRSRLRQAELQPRDL
jgi:hypothetical protein